MYSIRSGSRSLSATISHGLIVPATRAGRRKREFAAGYHGLQMQVSRAPTRALLNFYYLAIVLQITGGCHACAGMLRPHT